jgi:hypothetical protein
MAAVAVQAYLLLSRFGSANVDGSFALVDKKPPEISRGDLVRIAGAPGGSPILRVVAVPGDTVAVAHGQLTVDGGPVASAHGLEALAGVVPPKSYLLLRPGPGAESGDSRSLGFVHRELIAQRVLLKLGGGDSGEGR